MKGNRAFQRTASARGIASPLRAQTSPRVAPEEPCVNAPGLIRPSSVVVLLASWWQFHPFLMASWLHQRLFLHTLHPWRNPIRFFSFGVGSMNLRSNTVGITCAQAHPGVSRVRVGASVVARQTLRSTRTQPARAGFLSLSSAFSAPLVAPQQVGPVSFVR